MSTNCLQCNDEFHKKSNELFCSDECRLKFWKAGKKGKATTDEKLEDLRCMIESTRIRARSIVKSIDRIEEEYGDWEDRITAIEQQIYAMELEVNLEEKELPNNRVHQSHDIDFGDEIDALDDL